MEKKKWTFGIYLIVLALVFSIGLTFASVELPRLLHSALVKATPALEGDSHASEAAVYRTELFMDHYHLRVIGYACFGLMILLIIVGFITGKSGLSSIGAAAMFLPVFAQFAGVMFFLAGLGVLNLAWLPVLDVSFDIGRLGDIVYLPYSVIMSLFRGLGVDAHQALVYITVGGGLLLFTLGTLAWFVSRQRKSRMADFWVYRFSRHPQYLGWIVWSYGMLISLKRVRYPKRSWGIPASLPWLLSAMVIIGVALLEERKMKRLAGEAYDDYRRKTSLLFPIPRFVRALFAAPNRLLFKKSFPERKGEIAAVLVLYTVLLVVCSHFYQGHRRLAQVDVQVGIAETKAARVDKLIDEMRRTDNGRRRFRIAELLSDIGREAVDPLIGLLSDPNPANRQEAAWALGRIGSSRATGPLLERLAVDEEDGVRFQAVEALGSIGSREAVPALISFLGGENDALHRSAADALGRLGAEDAVGPLIETMDKPNWWDRSAVVDALGQIGSAAAVDPLAARLKDEEVHVRRSIVVTLLKIGSEKAAATLEDALDDEDWEVRLYAAEALKKLAVR